MLAAYIKDPDAVRQITIDWSDLLGTKTISAATWTIPSGLTKESESNTTTTASVILSGGAVNAEYNCICRITFGSTSPAEQDDRTIKVIIKQK